MCISNKYEYLKPLSMISIEYDVDKESYILRISLGKFLKGIIEIWPLEPESDVALIDSKQFLKNIERFQNSENSKSSDSFESFDTVH